MPDIEDTWHGLIKSTYNTQTHVIKNKRVNNHPILQRRKLRLREFMSLVSVAQLVVIEPGLTARPFDLRIYSYLWFCSGTVAFFFLSSPDEQS